MFRICFGLSLLLWTSAFANLDLQMEEARFLWEMEGKSAEALQKMEMIEVNAVPLEKWRPRLLRTEMLLRMGKREEAQAIWNDAALQDFPERYVGRLSQLMGSNYSVPWTRSRALKLYPNELFKALQREKDPLKAKIYLGEAARRSGAEWVVDLKFSKTGIPTLYGSNEKTWWQHPEQKTLFYTDLNNGMTQEVSALPFEITGRENFTLRAGNIWGIAPKGVYWINPVQQVERIELDDPLVWIGWIDRNLVQVNQNGDVEWTDGFQWKRINSVLSQDQKSPILEIQNVGKSIHVIHQSGRWTEVDFRRGIVNRRHINLDNQLTNVVFDPRGTVVSTTHDIKLLGLDGKWVWSKSLKEEVVQIQWAQSVIVVSLSNQNLVGLDASTGKELWSYQSKGSYLLKPVINQGRLWLDQGQGWVRLDVQTGTLQERRRLPWQIVSLQSVGKDLLAITREGLLLKFRLGAR